MLPANKTGRPRGWDGGKKIKGRKRHILVAKLRSENTVDLEIVLRKKNQERFEVLPWRWIVERTFGWLGRYRRMSKEYDSHPQSAEHELELVPHIPRMAEVAMLDRLIL